MPENWLYVTPEPLTAVGLREVATAFSGVYTESPEVGAPVRVHWMASGNFASVEQEPETLTVSLYPLEALEAELEPDEWAAIAHRLGAPPAAAVDITLITPQYRSLLHRLISYPGPDSSRALAERFVSHLAHRFPGCLLFAREPGCLGNEDQDT